MTRYIQLMQAQELHKFGDAVGSGSLHKQPVGVLCTRVLLYHTYQSHLPVLLHRNHFVSYPLQCVQTQSTVSAHELSYHDWAAAITWSQCALMVSRY